MALAKLYTSQVQGLNDPELTFSTGYYQTNVYDELYKIANDGMFQWWVRANEKQYQNGLAYMNKMLKQVGIPCQDEQTKDIGFYQLSCHGERKPWPTNLNTTELNDPPY